MYPPYSSRTCKLPTFKTHLKYHVFQEVFSEVLNQLQFLPAWYSCPLNFWYLQYCVTYCNDIYYLIPTTWLYPLRGQGYYFESSVKKWFDITNIVLSLLIPQCSNNILHAGIIHITSLILLYFFSISVEHLEWVKYINRWERG